jgi:hypothetical protein
VRQDNLGLRIREHISKRLSERKREKHCYENKREADHIIPPKRLSQVEIVEQQENHDRDHFGQDLKLDRRKSFITEPIGRHLKAILEKSDAPTDENDDPEWLRGVLQVTVPRECHKGVRNDQQQYWQHVNC